jgi:hypothetical protein
VKGKPWTIDEEKQLRELVEAKTHIDVIAVKLNRQPDAVLIKCKRLKLEVVVGIKKIKATTTSSVGLKLPTELPSVEEALKMLAGALDALKKGGVDKTEIIRLSRIIQGAEAYIDRVAEYMDYRGLEVEMLDWRAKYADLVKKASNATPK